MLLHDTKDLATLGQIGGPRHDFQVHSAHRQELRCSSTHRHGRRCPVQYVAVLVVDGLDCRSAKVPMWVTKFTRRRVTVTHVTLGETRPCSWDVDLHITGDAHCLKNDAKCVTMWYCCGMDG
jgi:hypothetical protein